MQTLTEDGRKQVDGIADKHGFSHDAGRALFQSLASGHGTMAQFNHPDLGGMGQWSQGGMIMIGDMFNNSLKGRVSDLCNDLARLVQSPDMFERGDTGGQSGGGSSSWWPADLGQPASSGGQNDQAYAFFPQKRRLAIRNEGRVTVYDSGDHQISGVSQQQGGSQSLSFRSQLGEVRPGDLSVVG